MACKPCAAKKARMAATNAKAGADTTQQTSIGAIQFETKRYIGPTGILASVLPKTSYGTRTSGSVMRVAKQDLLANPGLWEDV